MLAVQYLEPGPKIRSITPTQAAHRLQAAFERLPISHVLLGWNLPDALIDTCAEVSRKNNAKLYRWHPLLTGDGVFRTYPGWRTIALDGSPINGFGGLPEFTFMCPNHPAVREGVLSHLVSIARDDRYDGVFLDRIRYASPAENPEKTLGCFCQACQQAAAESGLDLVMTQRHLRLMLDSRKGAKHFIHAMIDTHDSTGVCEHADTLRAFMEFRIRTITRIVSDAAVILRDHRREIGLDCWSPALTRLVGQNLTMLRHCGDWVKVMTYAHAMGPAGLPFELLRLADWLMSQGISESETMARLYIATGLRLPQKRADLRQNGLPPEVLRHEGASARLMQGVMLAGVELVEIDGVIHLEDARISTNLAAFRQSGVDGLVLSWDLWEIPAERLELVRQMWVHPGDSPQDM